MVTSLSLPHAIYKWQGNASELMLLYIIDLTERQKLDLFIQFFWSFCILNGAIIKYRSDIVKYRCIHCSKVLKKKVIKCSTRQKHIPVDSFFKIYSSPQLEVSRGRGANSGAVHSCWRVPRTAWFIKGMAFGDRGPFLGDLICLTLPFLIWKWGSHHFLSSQGCLQT